VGAGGALAGTGTCAGKAGGAVLAGTVGGALAGTVAG
jgi:hypothetical protein